MAVKFFLFRQDSETVPATILDSIRGQVSSLLRTALAVENHPRLHRREETAIRTLRQDHFTTIIRTDKRNYSHGPSWLGRKMNHLISTAPYKEISSNPTKNLFEKVRNTLLHLQESNKIWKETYKSLMPESEVCPVLYESPKIHKPIVPMRPITDYRFSPAHKFYRSWSEFWQNFKTVLSQ